METDRIAVTMDRIYALMEQPPVRSVPKDLKRRARNSVTTFLLWFIGLWSVVFLGLLIFLQSQGAAPVMYILSWGVCVLIAFLALYWQILARNALVAGGMYRGKVIRVSPRPARINGRFFFRVLVEFTGPDGKVTRGVDTIDNWSSEYFLNARDSGDEVDVIYHPNPVGKVVLPMRMAIGSRYD